MKLFKIFILHLAFMAGMCANITHAQTKTSIISTIDTKVANNPTTPLRAYDLNVILKSILNYNSDTLVRVNDSTIKVKRGSDSFTVVLPGKTATLDKITSIDSTISHELLMRGSRIAATGLLDAIPNCVFFGYQAGHGNTGHSVTAIGTSAAYGNTNTFVTAVGNSAGANNTGQYLTAVGTSAASDNTANNVTAIGKNAGVGGNTYANVNLFGAGATPTAANQTVFGNATVPIVINHAVLTGSDTNKYIKVNIGGTDYWMRLLTALP